MSIFSLFSKDTLDSVSLPTTSKSETPKLEMTVDIGKKANSYSYSVAGPIEEAGIVAGEIVAWRAWKIIGRHLASMNGKLWLPGKPMRGREVDENMALGVHAFRTRENVLEYLFSGGAHYTCDPLIVLGRVHLWGVVIEHERGYRAEMAYPKQFIRIFSNRESEAAMAALQKHYGMGD